MRFIPKKKEVLIEADINPLEVNSVDLSYDEQYVQAIMKAVASESGAIVEYEQIMAIEPHVTKDSLIELFHDTLEDIKNEEIKHLAQLNEKLSQAPSLKNSYEDGEKEAETGEDVTDNTNEENKEQNESKDNELTESVISENVPAERTYDSEDIAQLISSKYQLTDEQYEDIIDLLDPLRHYELSAEDVDRGLADVANKYEFTPEEKKEIEILIINQAKNPQGERKEEFENDIQYDINTLEDLLDEFNTRAARKRVEALINELKAIEYNGDKNIGWNQKYHNLNTHKGGLID